MPPNSNQPNQNGQLPQPQSAQPPQAYQAPRPAPSYPAPAAAQEDASPYDFFLETKKQPKRSMNPVKGGLSLPKILIIAVGIFFILAILAVVLSATRKSDTSGTSLTSIVISQHEIIRINGIAETNLGSTNLKNFAATATASLTTSQQASNAYLVQHGGKLNAKLLAASADTRNDRLLKEALAASTYDTTYHSIMQRLLSDYEVKLQQLSSSPMLRSERTIVDKDLASAKLLEIMLGQQ